MKNPHPFLIKALGLYAVTFLLSIHSVSAQAAYNGSYTQNFDSMGTTGKTAPTGWAVYDEVGSHDTFSYFQDPASGAAKAGVTPNLTAGVLTPESALTAGAATTAQKGVAGYNFGTTASATDRALGTSPSGNAATVLELSLMNTTTSNISALDLSYDIRRFTTTTVDNNNFGSTDPNQAKEENPGYWLFYSLNGGTTWTNVSSLNPTLTGPNGVVVPDSVGVTSIPTTEVDLNGVWAAGGNLELAWLDDNAQSPSPDQLLGLDNVSISAVTAAPEPSTVALGFFGMCLIAGVMFRRQSQGSLQS
jgi:hypothetical protein